MKRDKFLIYWLPVLIYAVLIFYLSSKSYMPSEMAVKGLVSVSDSFMHVIEYSILSFLLFRAFNSYNFKNPYKLAIIIGIIYGITDEFHQYFVPGRMSSFNDIIYNSIGIVMIQGVIKLKNNIKP